MRSVIWFGLVCVCSLLANDKPNVIFIFADDLGYGDLGCYGHPYAQTPALDQLAKEGTRYTQAYVTGVTCCPSRTGAMTGRHPARFAKYMADHGFGDSVTITELLKSNGYRTGHFGKWHLNGLRGPGAPIFKEDTHHPGAFGFDEWLSVTNFFDRNPIMSRRGKIEEHAGDSSEIIVDEALKFIKTKVAAKEPFFTVIWYGTPHDPWVADDADKKPFNQLSAKAQEHYGELVAMDRSIGTLRAGLSKLEVDKNTLVWFTSDNGGLPRFDPPTTGGLRGFKGSMYEGGLRVPAIIEWPAGIQTPRVTHYPAGAVDIFPTLARVAGLKKSTMLKPQDGQSLVKLFSREIGPRKKTLPFRSRGRVAVVDNNYKMISLPGNGETQYELYDLKEDSAEQNNLTSKLPKVAKRLRKKLQSIDASVTASVNGQDYPGNKVDAQPPRIFWWESEAYRPYFSEWIKRPEYASRLKRYLGAQQKKKQP